MRFYHYCLSPQAQYHLMIKETWKTRWLVLVEIGIVLSQHQTSWFCHEVAHLFSYKSEKVLKQDSWLHHQNPFDMPHNKTNKIACAPSEDSDQSDQSLHCPHEESLGDLSYPLSAQQRLIRLGRCPGCSESALGAQSFCWFCHEVALFLLIYIDIDQP